MTIEERLRPAAALQPEIASLNMGSMNFGLYPMLGALPRAAATTGSAASLRAASTAFFRNTFRTSSASSTSCSRNGTRFEIECYDIGHLYTAAHFLERGVLQAPLFIQRCLRHPGRHRHRIRGRART
jgi:uncharacterized protein (DUF849 family)